MKMILMAGILMVAVSQGADNTGTVSNLPVLSVEAAITARSLVSKGDPTRLQHVMSKARRGESITIGVIGGSITEGAGAAPLTNRWADLVTSWWRARFPKSQIGYVNAGIGATGSGYGVFRMERDMLPGKPDLLVIEFAVNDPNTREDAETLEGIVRKTLAQPNHPAVILFFTMNNAGLNAQEWFAKVGTHYRLPMVSYRDALWPEIAAKRLTFNDIAADVIHPNNRGHRYAADFLISMLGQVADALPADGKLAALTPVAKPLFSNVYDQTEMYEFTPTAKKTITPAKVVGHWYLHDGAWHCDEPGATFELSIPGDRIFLQYERTCTYIASQVRVSVDARPPQVIETWWSYSYGPVACTALIGKDLGPGPHKIVITLLPEKHPQCPSRPKEAASAHDFKLFRVFAAKTGI